MVDGSAWRPHLRLCSLRARDANLRAVESDGGLLGTVGGLACRARNRGRDHDQTIHRLAGGRASRTIP
jgi:hypothetical protein